MMTLNDFNFNLKNAAQFALTLTNGTEEGEGNWKEKMQNSKWVNLKLINN